MYHVVYSETQRLRGSSESVIDVIFYTVQDKIVQKVPTSSTVEPFNKLKLQNILHTPTRLVIILQQSTCLALTV
jgi:hypothetical protein